MSKPKYNNSKSKVSSGANNRKNPKSRGFKHDNNSSNSESRDNVHVSDSINNPGYYFNNELLKTQLGTLSFNDFTGVPIALDDAGTMVDNIPYAMRIYLNPSAGFTNPQDSTARGSGLNLAGLQIYTQLTAANAKTSNYGPQDVTTLLLAYGSLISLISYAKRGFGAMYNYSLRNRAYPEKIMKAMGYAYDDLLANAANYRVRFNALLNQVSKLPIPSNIAYLQKCNDLYAGIYLDMLGSPMAQTYVFVPESVWLFDDLGSEEGTVLKSIHICDSDEPEILSSYDYILGQLERMVRALLESDTFNKIYADIIRLNQNNAMPLWTFGLLEDTYVVVPTYNPEIRKWINNLTVMGKPMEEPHTEGMTTGNWVYPDADTNKIVYRPQFRVPMVSGTLNRILNFDSGLYTVDDIIEATRLMATGVFEVEPYDAYYSTEVALPDHYVTAISIFTVNEDTITINHPSIDAAASQTLLALSDFDWHPIFITFDTETVQPNGIFGDLNYYTTVNHKYVKALQDATYFGLFEIRN